MERLAELASVRRPAADCFGLGRRPFKRSVRPASSVQCRRNNRRKDHSLTVGRGGLSGRGPATRGGCDKVCVGPSRSSYPRERVFPCLNGFVQQAVAPARILSGPDRIQSSNPWLVSGRKSVGICASSHSGSVRCHWSRPRAAPSIFGPSKASPSSMDCMSPIG